MNTFQPLNDTNQGLESLGSGSILQGPQRTLWIGNTEETPITAVIIRETKTKLVLKVRILDLYLLNLEVQVTPETVLIQGQPTESTGVEGFFVPSGFASLIPLPHLVQPQSCSTVLQPDGLVIQLAKHTEAQQLRLRFELPVSNSAMTQSCQYKSQSGT
ncbi:MAG: hypothetical protein ACM37W_00220 [Actinomycetota bacterium]